VDGFHSEAGLLQPLVHLLGHHYAAVLAAVASKRDGQARSLWALNFDVSINVSARLEPDLAVLLVADSLAPGGQSPTLVTGKTVERLPR